MYALDNGDKIRGDASTASVVDYILSGTDANAIKQLADGQLANEITDIYTADSVDAVTSIVLVNTHSSAVTVNLYLTPSGGSARRIIPVDMSLGIGYSLYTDGQRITVLDASGNISTVLSMALGNLSDVTLTSEADHDMLYYDNATSLWKNATPAAILAQLSGQAGAAFAWNSQNLTGIATLTATTLNSTNLGATSLAGTLSLNGQAFDAGGVSAKIDTTGSQHGLVMTGTHATHGVGIEFIQAHTTPDLNSIIGQLFFKAYDHAVTPALQNYAYIQIQHSNIGNGTEECQFDFKAMAAGSPYNTAMTLSGAGALWSDLSMDTLTYKVSGTQVVAAQGATVADATDANDVILRLNDLLARCRTHGLIAT